MKISAFLLSLFLMLGSASFAQVGENWKVIRSIKKKAKSISTDRLGNLYLVSNNDIWLYNFKGDSIAAFNSRKFGDITYIDTTDPYKILVFFKDYNLIVFLDNYLSQNGNPIDLQELGFDQVVMACQSRETGIWVFDQLRQKAYHLNDDFQVIHESVNLSQWFQKRITPSSMLEFNNRLYMNDSSSGIYVFDHFATYLKKIDIQGVSEIQLLENRINYLDSNNFCEYDLQLFEKNCRPFPQPDAREVRVEKNRLYVLFKDKAIIYQTN